MIFRIEGAMNQAKAKIFIILINLNSMTSGRNPFATMRRVSPTIDSKLRDSARVTHHSPDNVSVSVHCNKLIIALLLRIAHLSEEVKLSVSN